MVVKSDSCSLLSLASRNENAVVKKSLLLVEGNYVFFICSPEVEAMTKLVNTALGK